MSEGNPFKEQFRQAVHFDNFVNLLQAQARKGDMDRLSLTLKAVENDQDRQLVMQALLSDAIRAPDQYPKIGEMLDRLINRRMDFVPFFTGAYKVSDAHILGMPAKSPYGPVSHTAGVLYAEFIRAAHMAGSGYNGLNADAVFAAAGAIPRAAVEQSIVAVQNELVNHVDTDGPMMPFHRGAAFLLYLREENDPAAKLWTDRLEKVERRTVYDVKRGDLNVVTLHYRDPA